MGFGFLAILTPIIPVVFAVMALYRCDGD